MIIEPELLDYYEITGVTSHDKARFKNKKVFVCNFRDQPITMASYLADFFLAVQQGLLPSTGKSSRPGGSQVLVLYS